MTSAQNITASSDHEADIAIANAKRSMWRDFSKKINPENPNREMIEHAISKGFQPEGKALEQEPKKIREMIQDIIRENASNVSSRKKPVYICSHNGENRSVQKERSREE